MAEVRYVEYSHCNKCRLYRVLLSHYVFFLRGTIVNTML